MGNTAAKSSLAPRSEVIRATSSTTETLDTRSKRLSKGQNMPLTRDHVVKFLMQVRENDKMFVRRRMIHEILRISDFKSNEIICGCKSDEERLNKLVEFWLVWCPFASWRWLIWYLDLYEYYDIVDQIYQFAEPLTVPSLTLENVSAIVHACNITTYTLNDCLGVSDGTMPGVRKRISRLSENDDEYKVKLISWWLLTSPFAAWEFLAESFSYWKSSVPGGHLYSSNGCKLAYAQTIKYFECQQEDTLTPDNLRLALEKTPYQFYHPEHERRYTTNLIKLSTSINKEELVVYYQHRHPAPTWKGVAHFMYYTHEYEVLEFILRRYLSVNGELSDTPTEVTSNEEGVVSNDITSLLSVDNVVKILLEHVKVPLGYDTKNWNRPRYIGFHILCISHVTMDHILRTCTCDELEQLDKLVAFWLKKCPLASWRWLIWRLQDCHHIKAMKVIQPFAEPLTGSYLTVANLMAVFMDIEIEVVKQCLVIPQNYTTETLQQQTEDVVKQEMFAWWLMSSPFASWDMIAAEDCYAGPAVRLVKSRLPDITRPASLSLQNFENALRDIPETNCYRSVLGLFIVPGKTVQEIEQLYPHLSRKQAILQSFLDAHPCGLSWRLIAYKVYKYASRFNNSDSNRITTSHNLYQLISDIQQYNKGQSLHDLCVKVVSKHMKTLEDVQFLPLPAKIKMLVELAIDS